jgi:hypothetical protein
MKGDIAVKIAFALCAFLLSLVISSQSQDHAPTVEQCRADQRLWLSVMHDEHAFKDAVSQLSVETLKERSREMRDCFAVDSENARDYFDLVTGYGTELSGRYKNFIERHHLMTQFLAEDAAGKR